MILRVIRDIIIHVKKITSKQGGKMRTVSKRLLSSVLATMLLGQNLLCNNAFATEIKASTTSKEALVQQIEDRAEELKDSGADSPISLFSFGSKSDNVVDSLNISGYVKLEDGRTSDVTVLIFDDNWNTIAQTTVDCGNNGYFSISAPNIKSSTSTTHVKIECNGYLPRFYKDMGFGSYQLGTYDNPEVLYFGDTTYNPNADNQWSDEVINYDDLTFVFDQIGKIRGDENYDEEYDFNQDGVINDNDLSEIKHFNGAIYEDGFLYTDSTKTSYYVEPEGILRYDLNFDNVIDNQDCDYFHEMFPKDTYKGDEDFEQIAYIDINENGKIDDDDYNYFRNYIDNHNGHNPYNDYIYNLTLTGDSYHEGAMYLENTNLDLASYDLVVNGNFVFRTQNPYNNALWGDNPSVTLNINAGTLFIAEQFDFGQANSYDKIVMTNDNGKLYVNGIWNYITLADMEGLWTKGTIYFFGSTWQVNEASGDKSIYSTGTHSICFYYQYGQQVIRWANTEDCIYNEETGEYNTLRRFNFDYKDSNGNCLGLTFPCGYSDDKYYFRASLPEEITYQNAITIPYEDWGLLNDDDANGIPDVIDTQIKNENYEAIPNEWLEDNYGDVIDEFIVNEASFSISDLNNNKKSFVDFLYYLLNNYDKNSKEYEKAIQLFNYLKDSLVQIVAGDYAENTTILGTLGQIAISVVPTPLTWGLDLVFDLRDISQNFVLAYISPESMQTSDWQIDLFFDLVSIIPEFGTELKQAKRLDTITGIDGILKFIYQKLLDLLTDDTGNIINSNTIKNISKAKGIVDKFIKDSKKLAQIQDEFKALSKLKGTDDVLEFYTEYGIDALENVSKHKSYYDKIKDVLKNFTDETNDILDIIDHYLKDEEEDSLSNNGNKNEDTETTTTEHKDIQLDYALDIIIKFGEDGIVSLYDYDDIQTYDIWDKIDDYRDNLNQPRVKNVHLAKGDGLNTVALIKTGDTEVWGVNSKIQTKTEKEINRNYYNSIKNIPQYIMYKSYGNGSAAVFCHAEGHALVNAYNKLEGNMDETTTIYVDRETCAPCRNYQIDLARSMKITNLIMVSKDDGQYLCTSKEYSYYYKIDPDGTIEQLKYSDNRIKKLKNAGVI